MKTSDMMLQALHSLWSVYQAGQVWQDSASKSCLPSCGAPIGMKICEAVRASFYRLLAEHTAHCPQHFSSPCLEFAE